MEKVLVRLPIALACTLSLGLAPYAHADEVMMQGLAQPLYSQPSYSDLNQKIQANPDAAIYKNRAKEYRKAGLRSQAVDDLNQALHMVPTDATAYWQRAQNYYDEGMYQEAVRDCASAVKIDPNFGDAYVLRARASNKLHKWQDAISDCAKLFSLKKNLADAYLQRGIAYDGMGKYSNAIDDCTAALSADNTMPKAFYMRADAYQAMGQYPKAIDDYSQAIKLQPNNRPALLARAWCNLKAGNDAQAADDCRKAVRFDPAAQMAMNKYIGEKYNDANFVPDADYKFGSDLADDLKNALTLYGQVLKDKPGDPDALRDRGLVYMHLAKYAEASRDFDDANNGVTAAAGSEFPGFGSQSDFQQAQPLYKQGNDDLTAGNYAAAIDHYSSALKIYPQFGKCWHNLAIAYGYNSDYVSAELCAIHAISYRPDDWKLWNTLGYEMFNEFQHDKGDPNKLDAAEAALKHSLALNPPADSDRTDVRKLLAAVNNYERSLAPANYVVVTTMPLN
jgi:tetratricopeptide (TPR) repeat protein